MAMAIENSVTVSMGEDTNGAFKMIFLVRAEVRSCIEQTSQQIFLNLIDWGNN